MKRIVRLIILITLPVALFASESSHSESAHHLMAALVVQIGVILFASRFGASLFTRIKLPSVLGEIVAGVLIGPYMLGGIPFIGFSKGLFPLPIDQGVPVSPELYGVATIASILLLFMAGLGTDLKLFYRFSFTGSLIGIGTALVSFVVGLITATNFLGLSYTHPLPLFMGVLCTATSVDITVRILSENKKLDAPESVTLMAGAVVDNILSIILLAMITGYFLLEGDLTSGLRDVAFIGVRAIGVWLLFTVLGLVFANKIAKLLKISKNLDHIAVLSFGMALLLAGIFERAGLAMIIGAYIMGLTLSKTDLNLIIQEKLHGLEKFLDPIFFTAIGMFVNVFSFVSIDILIFGIVFSVGAIVAKIIGAGIPASFLNFNKLGALRIGFGMMPRGEVAFIFAGIGLSAGILTQETFAVSIMMTLSSTLLGPIVLDKLLKKDEKGTKHDIVVVEKVEVPFECNSYDIAELVEKKIINSYYSEGFYINRLDSSIGATHFQRNEMVITLYKEGTKMIFDANVDDEPFVQNMLYETMADLSSVVSNIKDIVKPKDMKMNFSSNKKSNLDMSDLFKPELIELHLKATDKQGVIDELVRIIFENGYISDVEEVTKAVLDREKAVSTGMGNGIALPHGRVDVVDKLTTVVGISRNGLDFEALDEQPVYVIVLTLVPTSVQAPYVQFLAAVATVLNGPEKVQELLEKKTKLDLIEFFTS